MRMKLLHALEAIGSETVVSDEAEMDEIIPSEQS
jgi:hypothetical protein